MHARVVLGLVWPWTMRSGVPVEGVLALTVAEPADVVGEVSTHGGPVFHLSRRIAREYATP